MIREIIELEGANPYGRRLEFYEGNKVLGYADYSLIYDRIELDNIYVEETRRRECSQESGGGWSQTSRGG